MALDLGPHNWNLIFPKGIFHIHDITSQRKPSALGCMPLLNIPVTFSVASNILRVIIYLSVSSTKLCTGIDSTFFCVLVLGFSILFKMLRLNTQEYKEKKSYCVWI